MKIADDSVQKVMKCETKLQTLVYDILPSTTAVFSYAIGSRKLSANEQFFVGAQTVVSLLQTTQIKQGVSFIAANKVYTSTNKTTLVRIKKEHSFLYPRWMRLMFTFVLWRYAASTVILIPEPFGGRGDKECPFSGGVTKFGRVWRKVTESDARSVVWNSTQNVHMTS